MRLIITALLLVPMLCSGMVGLFCPGQMASIGVNPAQFSGLKLWLDAGRTGISSGGSLDSWKDFSGDGRDANQATLSYRPTMTTISFGRQTVLFDGVDDCLTTLGFTSLNVPLTIFLVWKSTAFPTGAHVIMANSAANNFGFHNDGTSTPRAYLMNGGVVDTYATSTTSFAVIDIVWNGASTRFSTNNATFVTGNAGASATTLPGLVFGQVTGNYFWGGQIAEVIVYNRDLTTSEHSAISRYLGVKYGLKTQ